MFSLPKKIVCVGKKEKTNDRTKQAKPPAQNLTLTKTKATQNMNKENYDNTEEAAPSEELPPEPSRDGPTKTKRKERSSCVVLPHPCSLNVLPSPTNKWSVTSHPIKAKTPGFYNTTISCKHYFFHDSRVLLTQAFAASTTSTTVGDGGSPCGSTKLDEETGHNCKMTANEFQDFALLVLGLDTHSSAFGPSKHSHGFKQTESSFLNMLLNDFAVITNLHPAAYHNNEGDRLSLARSLARCTLLLTGAEALTPNLIRRVWGANETVRRNLGGPRGDLALIRRRLISMSAVAINAFHLWMTTEFDGMRVITSDSTRYHPRTMQEILKDIMLPSSATYVREPLAAGTERVEWLLSCGMYLSFEDMAARWYHDLLLRGRYTNDSTGVENKILLAYGAQLKPPTTHNA